MSKFAETIVDSGKGGVTVIDDVLKENTHLRKENNDLKAEVSRLKDMLERTKVCETCAKEYSCDHVYEYDENDECDEWELY